jgi:hypothetical protein
VSARAAVMDAVRQGRLDELAALAAADPRALRHLLALSYRPEPELRAAAGRAIAAASRHHPELVQEMARRLVWAMNDESGTHALTAPEVLRAIAEENPELLLPLLPELLRLTADPGLHDALVGVARLVAARDRHGAATTVATALNACATRGGRT